ncbi:hypothetical protein RA8P2_00118 (plasmid) [Variovorax sp. RA8]|nr:hypothetical protein RA8P2_00118 [Variovorax sp. RA8]
MLVGVAVAQRDGVQEALGEILIPARVPAAAVSKVDARD